MCRRSRTAAFARGRALNINPLPVRERSNVLCNLTDVTCSVIPPHVLHNVARHGDGKQRQRVLSTLTQTEELAASHGVGFLGRAVPPNPRPMRRHVYDAGHRRSLPGKLVLSDGDNLETEDVEAKEAFDGARATYDFFKNVLLRNSIDNKGAQLDSSVHYGVKFDNALWNGRQMIYGDGDGELFNRFTVALDVIGHELSHGVTQSEAALEYTGESGALNEHLSDAFGIMVKQYRFASISQQSDWLIGAGLLGPSVHGVAVRSMVAPGTAHHHPGRGKDPPPCRMRDYVDTLEDNGGVHINSGIPNHAFYRAARNNGRFAWDVVGKIWYWTLIEKVAVRTSFQDFADAPVMTASERHGH